MARNRKQNDNACNGLQYRRKWLYQLRAEFSRICSWYGLALAAPAFRISGGRSTLGAWHPETRTISISSTLISEYSWDAVMNVLKHEIAHQYVHEAVNRGFEPPHGRSFAEACKMLGVAHPFNTATGDTPKVFTAAGQHSSDTEYDRKVRKVRKMLSLAGSVNRHEAAVAMSKANSFIRRYNLERLEAGAPSCYGYDIIRTRKKRLQVIERRIASLLMDYFYVDIIYSELFEAGSLETYKTIELLGTRENVALAKHVYDFLNQRVEFLWQNYRRATKTQGRLRKTYILGLLQGFREKLAHEEKKQRPPIRVEKETGGRTTISALVVARDPGLLEFTARRFPRLRKVQYRLPYIGCAATFRAGKREGGKITVYRPLGYEDGNRGRLLGG